jgi:hypothetical protein
MNIIWQRKYFRLANTSPTSTPVLHRQLKNR